MSSTLSAKSASHNQAPCSHRVPRHVWLYLHRRLLAIAGASAILFDAPRVGVLRLRAKRWGELAMDRRDFLKTSGAAAVAAGTVAQTAEAEVAESRPAPTVLAAARSLGLVSGYAPNPAGLAPERLARRIETATGGRYRLDIQQGSIDADLSFGPIGRHANLHRAFAFFAGLPFAQGLDALSQHAWLATGGGEMLWDELAARFGFKPLLAGHTGSSPGVWAMARLERASDLDGATLHVAGLAADAVRVLGATPVEMAPDDLKAALATGRVRAAEWLGPVAALSPGLQPPAQRLYEPGFHRGGVMLSLDVRKSLWDGMSASDRAIFEACAAQEYHLSLADARAHALIAGQVQAEAKWPVRVAMSDALADALDLALADVLQGVAAADPEGRRIHDSYQAFRRLLGEDVIA
jgi:TRAP-type mannitol/chloroaromatic compound transport system substrate-binding protein